MQTANDVDGKCYYCEEPLFTVNWDDGPTACRVSDGWSYCRKSPDDLHHYTGFRCEGCGRIVTKDEDVEDHKQRHGLIVNIGPNITKPTTIQGNQRLDAMRQEAMRQDALNMLTCERCKNQPATHLLVADIKSERIKMMMCQNCAAGDFELVQKFDKAAWLYRLMPERRTT